MRSRLAMLVATCGGLGYAPLAPGTVGTLAAVPLFPLLARVRAASPLTCAAIVLAVLALAVWAATAASRALGEVDSPRIVIDEVAGYVVAVAMLDFSWLTAGLAFCLFRLFDILKPFPASWVDRNVGSGLGVVGDDVISGLFTAAVAGVLQCLV